METIKNTKDIVPFCAIHPGEILGDELKARHIKQKDFALKIGMQPSYLSETIKGKHSVTSEMALKLEQELGIPYNEWINLQAEYDKDVKLIAQRDEATTEALQYEKTLDTNVNCALLYKHLGIEKQNVLERTNAIKKLFPFDLLNITPSNIGTSVIFKHSEKAQCDDRNMLTWVLINWQKVREVSVSQEYKEGNAKLAASAIAQMANAGTLTVKDITECLNSYGIVYVHVPKIEKAPIDACSTYANGHPTISVTYRYNDIDKLAFDILHELGHIDMHLKNGDETFVTINNGEYSSDPLEMAANDFARNALISKKEWDDILSSVPKSVKPHAVVNMIATRASERGISKSIAVARFKKESEYYAVKKYRSPKIR